MRLHSRKQLKSKKLSATISLAALLFSANLLGFVDGCRAGEKSIEEEIAELRARIAELERKLAEKKQPVEELRSGAEHIDVHLLHREDAAGFILDGLRIGAGATFVVQGTQNANATPRKGDDRADATYSVDLEAERKIGETGLAFLLLEAGQGAGLDGDELNLFGGVNADAGDSDANVQVTEFWYEHGFLEGSVTLTAGKLDPTVYLDTNAAANDETTQFLASTFRNSTALEFPGDNGPAVRLALAPLKWLEVNMGAFDDDADFENIGDDSFLFAQLNLRPGFFGREGNYRFYLWHDNSEHAKLLEPSRNREPNYGFGLSFDQKIDDSITLFARFGREDPRVSTVEYAWSGGLQLGGGLWRRKDDVLGMAFGRSVLGEEWGRAGNPDHPESHMEAYYNIHVNEHLSITPDLQVIWNPNGVSRGDEGRAETVYVFGVRGQLTF